MNLLEWRNSPERRSMAIDMLNQPTMKEMLLVMETEHPGRHPQSVKDGFDATRALGRIEGYQELLNIIRKFAEPLPSRPEEIETRWGVDKEPKS